MQESYWRQRWQNQETGWDIKAPSQPLVAYLEQIHAHKRNLSVLVPGCGSGYEALYMLEAGYTDVTMLDFAHEAIARLEAQLNAQPLPWKHAIKPTLADFYQHQGQYDLIIEQTFLSTVPPEGRLDYARQMARLLKPDGKLVGVVFNELRIGAEPPFSATKADYLAMFEPFFEVLQFELCYNSIAPRAGTEFFIMLTPKR